MLNTKPFCIDNTVHFRAKRCKSRWHFKGVGNNYINIYIIVVTEAICRIFNYQKIAGVFFGI